MSVDGGAEDVREVALQFSARYKQSRGPNWDGGQNRTLLPAAIPRSPPGSVRKWNRYSRSSSVAVRLSTLNLENLGEPDSPSSPHRRRGLRRLVDAEKKIHLRQIRTTELPEVGDAAEDPLPQIPAGQPTFSSAAHLRSDEYWTDLLGRKEGAERALLRWADSKWWQALIAAAIVGNSLLFGLAGEQTPGWQVFLKDAILAFSAFELGVAAYRVLGGVPWRDNEEQLLCAIDALAVVFCLAEQWVLPMVLWAGVSLPTRNAPFLARMLWLTRFLRLVRIVPALHELVRGVFQALTGLFWVFVFVFMMLYILAVLSTVIIGHREFDQYFGRDQPYTEEAEEVRRLFSNVGSSMFVLFETMSSWSLMPLIPLFEAAPGTRMCFAVFYVYAGWTLLAVMTGTVSFTMIAIKAQIVGEDEAREEEHRLHVQAVLADIFERLDQDGSGSLDHEEFKMILQSPDVLRLLSEDTNIKVQDLEDLWSWLDDDGSDEVSVTEFMQGFQWLNEPFRPKILLRMQEKVCKDISQLGRRLERLVCSRFDFIIEQVQAPLRKIHAVTEQVQVLGATLSSLRAQLDDDVLGADDGMAMAPSVRMRRIRKEIQAMERRLNEFLEDIEERVERFEAVPPPEFFNMAMSETSGGDRNPHGLSLSFHTSFASGFFSQRGN